MSHSDPEFLALSALGEETNAGPEAAHLAQCPDCQLELGRLARVVEVARGDGPVLLEQPPAAVWARIAAAVESDSAVETEGAAETQGAAQPEGATEPGGAAEPAVAPHRARPRAGRRSRRPRRTAAGLAAGLVIGIGGTLGVVQLTRPPATPVVAQIPLAPLPQFPQWQRTTGTAVLRQTQAAQQLTVTVTVPARKGFYEVWLLGRNGTSMISLGDLNNDHAGTFSLPAGVDLAFYSRIDVSLQPFNGSTVHSSVSVVRGALPPAVTRTS